MDGQTELAWHIRAIAYMLSRVKTAGSNAGNCRKVKEKLQSAYCYRKFIISAVMNMPFKETEN